MSYRYLLQNEGELRRTWYTWYCTWYCIIPSSNQCEFAIVPSSKYVPGIPYFHQNIYLVYRTGIKIVASYLTSIKINVSYLSYRTFVKLAVGCHDLRPARRRSPVITDSLEKLACDQTVLSIKCPSYVPGICHTAAQPQ